MDETQVLAKFRDVFADVMDIDDPEIGMESTAKDFEEWDSLSNIRLVVAVERAFGTRFSNADIEGFSCVGDLVRALVARAG
ncbi:acyl carrier protein [Polymorphobacter multimanifer]|uniref:Acyl carrier protein n=1 Tax=Polymorphobacter multimanifer TaxID=1070431 RepID=A0A841LCK1_9SPHN|nr:acyl carrier protein [Polymorphobacter multimanifer]MBB6226862.1 acyl carrier protein [Polymorphobacter multimanifer]